MKIVLIPGTWANSGRDEPQDSWWLPGSPFACALFTRGFEPLSFAWDTALDGVIGPDADWEKAATRLYNQCADLQPCIFIAHSHGGQLPFLAAVHKGLAIRFVITMATPVRSDIPYGEARKNVGRWVHFYGGRRDLTQLLGELVLCNFNVLRRKMPLADRNVEASECGHSDLHTVEAWDKYGIWQELPHE